MLRLRRSRIVIFLTLVTCFLFYNLYSKTDAYNWAKQYARPAQYPAGNAAQEAAKPAVENGVPAQAATLQPTTTEAALKAAFEEQKTLVQAVQSSTIATSTREHVESTTAAIAQPPQTTKPVADIDPEALGKALGGPPKYGLPSDSSSSSKSTSSSTTHQVHWSKMPEHFPVPSESVIVLPTTKPKLLPKVQHVFKDESALEKTTREKRQAEILKTFKKSWNGYVEYAWLHDELKPKSGGFKDPFCGWAATLVDSLDTLLIMGLEKEFEHALEGLAQIDFTTSARRDIPLFETTIRYLGGLLSAYDLSDHKHQIILDQAVQLAEILIGAFDTPNRMPDTFYAWRPAFVMNPHRAKTRVVMAELGSLSMEFTRLAQLTHNDKYYDAIARITNEMEEYQSRTKIPGLWPLYIDASGCKKPESTHQQVSELLDSELRNLDSNPEEPRKTIVAKLPPGSSHEHGHDEPEPPKFDHEANKGRIGGWDDTAVDRTEAGGKVPTRHGDGPVLGTKAKRQLDSAPQGVPAHDPAPSEADKAGTANVVDVGLPGKKVAAPAKVDCLPQGLASPPGAIVEEFSFGGMADSTYEYLPKQFALLGGTVSQYQSMYEKAIDAANKWLLFRPMTPTDEEIVILGIGKTSEDPSKSGELKVKPGLEHLLCFAGGMYGLGAKLFDRPKDLELAKQMTDSCVWAYGITSTGIMPESMELLPCDSIADCKWNQTAWEETMDPYPENRIADGNLAKQRQSDFDAQKWDDVIASLNDGGLDSGVEHTGSDRSSVRANYLKDKALVQKRDLGFPDEDPIDLSKKTSTNSGRNTNEMVSNAAAGASNGQAASGNEKAVPKAHVSPTPTVSYEDARVLPHSEYVKYREEKERLPKGVVNIASRNYILRPEAIESVFYMYRITGDPAWREKGWKMFEAVQAATDTTYGASAITDVTEDKPNGETTKSDAMESFWLAETLKYFYLLFSDEDTINLDEWVLNTEAHPFKRPA